MKAPWLRIVLAAALLLLFAPGAEARRVALVVGNGAYLAVPRLANPGRDAEDVAAAFRRLGFQVRLVRDGTRANLEAALQAFARDTAEAEVAAFFFAGHGIEVAGENHLIPVDARLAGGADLEFQTVRVNAVLRAMAGAQTRLVFLDACRDNPFVSSLRAAGTRSVAFGLGRIETADLGTFVAFATAPGAVAADGTGRNSPFSAALVRHLAEPGLEVRQVMTRVRRSVIEATGGAQVPWDNSSLVTDVVLAPAGSGAPAPPPQLAMLPTGPAAQAARAGRDNWAAARAFATEKGIRLPAEIAPAAAQAAGPLGHWIGAWTGHPQGGRARIIIIPSIDPATGTAEVIYAESDAGPRSLGQRPGFWQHAVGRATAAELGYAAGWQMRLIRTSGDRALFESRAPEGTQPPNRFSHPLTRVD